MDIGANTGKWSLKCMEYDKEVELGLVDLGVQLNVAKQNIEEANFGDRATYHEMDIRDPKNTLPKGYDIIWMSQFLDCFSDEQIRSEEHTSELQSRPHLVCRLLLEKKNKK